MLSYHCSFLLKYLKFPGFWCIQLLDIFCVLDYANQLLDIFCVLVYANVFSSPSLFFLWNNRETLYTSYKSFFCEVFSYLFISFPSGIPLNLYGFCTLGSVQFSLSVMSDSLRPYEPQHARLPCPSPTPRVHPNPCPLNRSSSHLILCHPLLLLPSIFRSIRLFSNESALRIRWPKYWSFSFSISPSNEYWGLISFRMDWLDLFAVQGTARRSNQSILKEISHWKDWCWSSNTLATWCEELTHLKRPWCCERLRAGGEGDDRG